MDKGILGAKTVKQAARLMKANVFTAPELIEATYENIEARKNLNAYVTVRDKEEALREAEASQKRIERSKLILFCSLRLIASRRVTMNNQTHLTISFNLQIFLFRDSMEFQLLSRLVISLKVNGNFYRITF